MFAPNEVEQLEVEQLEEDLNKFFASEDKFSTLEELLAPPDSELLEPQDSELFEFYRGLLGSFPSIFEEGTDPAISPVSSNSPQHRPRKRDFTAFLDSTYFNFNSCSISKISPQEFKIEGTEGDLKGVVAKSVRGWLKQNLPDHFQSFCIRTEQQVRWFFSLKEGGQLPPEETLESVLRMITGYKKEIPEEVNYPKQPRKRRVLGSINFSQFNITESRGTIQIINTGKFETSSLTQKIRRNLKVEFPSLYKHFMLTISDDEVVKVTLKEGKTLPNNKTLKDVISEVLGLKKENIVSEPAAEPEPAAAANPLTNSTNEVVLSSLQPQLPSNLFESTSTSSQSVNNLPSMSESELFASLPSIVDKGANPAISPASLNSPQPLSRKRDYAAFAEEGMGSAICSVSKISPQQFKLERYPEDIRRKKGVIGLVKRSLRQKFPNHYQSFEIDAKRGWWSFSLKKDAELPPNETLESVVCHITGCQKEIAKDVNYSEKPRCSRINFNQLDITKSGEAIQIINTRFNVRSLTERIRANLKKMFPDIWQHFKLRVRGEVVSFMLTGNILPPETLEKVFSTVTKLSDEKKIACGLATATDPLANSANKAVPPSSRQYQWSQTFFGPTSTSRQPINNNTSPMQLS